MKNVDNGGGRWLDVSAERFPGWIASFDRRHGVTAPAGAAEDAGIAAGAEDLAVTVEGAIVTFTAPDGAVAQCHPPFNESLAGLRPAGTGLASTAPAAVAETIAAHARTPRTVGVLLVRLGGYAAGVFTGYPPELADAKAGARPVHGRSAAGGWSQQRFARRREKQANEALEAAANTAVLIFGRAPRLDAVVLGGDKRAMAELRGDPRLARYLALATERFLTVPDPKRGVLLDTPRLFTAVRIRLTEP
ncbi:MAG TPA: acVLRF1 family peptidyl-tRNA hydrolase [Trebonia sp.]|nr:acVLRF1 family peptidyl-tRNA hydrolase [Trebonia sp.]